MLQSGSARVGELHPGQLNIANSYATKENPI